MSRIDNIMHEAADSLRFIDPKSATGRRTLTLQGNNIRTGNEHLLVLDGSTLYCTIEKAPSGWAARFGLQELSQVQPTLDACKEMIRQRRRSTKESLREGKKVEPGDLMGVLKARLGMQKASAVMPEMGKVEPDGFYDLDKLRKTLDSINHKIGNQAFAIASDLTKMAK